MHGKERIVRRWYMRYAWAGFDLLFDFPSVPEGSCPDVFPVASTAMPASLQEHPLCPTSNRLPECPLVSEELLWSAVDVAPAPGWRQLLPKPPQVTQLQSALGILQPLLRVEQAAFWRFPQRQTLCL